MVWVLKIFNQKVIDIYFKSKEIDENNLLESLTAILEDYTVVDEVIIEKQFTTNNLKRICSHCESFFVINRIKVNLIEPKKKQNNLILQI